MNLTRRTEERETGGDKERREKIKERRWRRQRERRGEMTDQKK